MYFYVIDDAVNSDYYTKVVTTIPMVKLEILEGCVHTGDKVVKRKQIPLLSKQEVNIQG